MNNSGVCLAAREGLGRIYDCGACGNIHVQLGPVTVTLESEAYMQFVDLVSTSAANFEVWLQLKNGNSPSGWQDDAHKEGQCKENES